MYNQIVNKQTLKNQLKSKAGAVIYNRGVDYYNRGKVNSWNKIPIVASDQISINGKVQGAKIYKTNLIFDWRKNQFLDLDCRCPYGRKCKHTVALGLEFIESLSEVKANTKIREPKKIFDFPKIDINKCYLLLGSDEQQNSINTVKIYTNRYSTISPATALRQTEGLTKAQKDLLTLLDETDYYFSADDYVRLFQLLQTAGLKFYWNNKNNQLYFDKQPSLIKASLSLERRKYYFTGKVKSEFVLKLADEYKRKKVFLLLAGKDYLIKIEDHLISFHQLPKELIQILDRINLSNQGYSIYNNVQSFETFLRADEIINLNQVIKAGATYLNLSTDLKPNFQIIESKKADPCVLVDYQSKKDQLEIYPTIDYGFAKIKVANTVSRSQYRGKDSFNRMSSMDQDGYIIKVSRTKIDYAKTQARKEIEIYKFFYYKSQEYGFTRNLKCRHEGEKAIFNFLKKYWPNLQNLSYKIEFLKDEFNLRRENFSADFKVDLNADNDWLYFDLNCYCGSDQINIEHLRAFVEDKKEFLKLESGRLLQIANIAELERLILMLDSFYKREAGGFEGRLYHAPELEGILTSSKYYQAKLKQSFTNFIKEAQSGQPVEKIKLPAQFNVILRDYQKQGIDWFYFLRKYRFAGILADDMGLGKTLQALVLMKMERRKNKPSIVICPKTLVYNWQNEAKKFIPSLKTLVVDGTAEERRKIIKSIKKADIIITGYAAIKKDWGIYDKIKIKFNYCILDEAQFIKNHATKNAQIVKKINADYRLALTGTPLENSVSEIWSIFDFLMPGFLSSYKLFQKKFHNPIMKKNCAKALDHLRQKIKCFMLRRLKSEVLKELPPKVEQYSFCHLEKAQNILYQEILINVKREIFTAVKQKGFKKAQIHILAGLTKLRQVCNHPVLLLKDKDYTKYESAKLEMFVELIDEIIGNKRKVLVFSQFTQMLDILAKDLNKREVKYFYLSGKTKNRQEMVDRFNTDKSVPVFLISLRAGGTGLNLTSADNVIIFDPWWNPSVENQAIDRTHRIGQKNSVNVYRLITKGTIEEKIVNLQEKKKVLFDNLVGESKDLFKKLTWDDVKGLFV